MNAICVSLFQGWPAKCSFSNDISGTIFIGVRGEVVRNKVRLSTLAIFSLRFK